MTAMAMAFAIIVLLVESGIFDLANEGFVVGVATILCATFWLFIIITIVYQKVKVFLE